jgi:predicted nucleotidyltransferase
MKSKEEIIKTLQKNKDFIKQKYGVKYLALFGSFARGEQTDNSYIDILVEFYKEKKTFDNYMDLKFYLESLFNRKVDLITKKAIKPRLKKYIDKDLIDV